MTVLRPYQENDVRALRAAFKRHRRVLYQLPTGGGKTVVYSWLSQAVASRGKRVTILEHRRELVAQASAKLLDAGVEHGIIDATSKGISRQPVLVASVMTLVRRLEHYAPPDLLVIDEAHHAVAGSWDAIIRAYAKSLVLGVTATPERLDGKGLASHFDELVQGPPVRELIDGGFLADYVAYRRPQGDPDLTGVHTTAGDYDKHELAELMCDADLVGDAVEHYQRHAAGKPAIAFCVTIEHAELVAAAFQAAGIRAFSVDGTMAPGLRDQRIGGLATGETQVLTSCMLVSEGLDIPGIVAAILMRPTQSLALYLQQVGRSLRPKDGQPAIILDHAGNMERHGMPCDHRKWSLEDRKKKGKAPSPVKTCFSCYATVAASCRVCPHCGAVFPVLAKEPPGYVNGKLVETKPVWSKFPRNREGIDAAVSQVRSFKDLKDLGKAMGFNKGWAYHRAEALGWEKVTNYAGYTTNFIPHRKAG